MAAGLAIAVANGVLGKLGEIAAQQLVNEASLLLNFREDFRWLQKKFAFVSVLAQAADEQSEVNVSVKQWLSEVHDIAFDAKDIIDECAVELLYSNTSQSCVYICSQLVFLWKMGMRIRELKERINSNIQKAEELNFVHKTLRLSQPSPVTLGRERGAPLITGSIMEEQELRPFEDLSRLNQPSERRAGLRRGIILEEDTRAVGLEEKVEEIDRLLEDPAIGVVAVLGMIGMGKTFLMKHLYDTRRYRYEASAWVCVSQTCSIRSLQINLAYQIDLQIEGGISDWLVADLIYNHLEDKRCLIVLDDVWNSSIEGNLIQRLGLPSGSNSQSRIVVTTRDREVAVNMRAHVYEMQLLSEEDSWHLFCVFAFPDSEGNRPPEHLESLALQIVEKCARLPLAIKAIATFLATNSDIAYWESKLSQLMDAVWAEDPIMQILLLSYNSLPSHLKLCFSYFSFFPDNTQISFSRKSRNKMINHEYLIYLWIAEGFIIEENDRDQFYIGVSYLQQLQSLLEVDRVEGYFTVRDFLLYLAINRSKEQKYEFHLPQEETHCRRLLLSKKGITTNSISESSLHRQRFLRTISFSQNPGITSIPKHLFDRLRVLRVLDLSSTTISTLPKRVGKLKLLKILNLSQTKITEVPGCVRKLKSLEYLDVSGCKGIRRLPHWIGEVQSLSHLDTSDCSFELLSHVPKEISKLSNLRTLRSDPISLSTHEEYEILDVQRVGRLTNLEEISFYFVDSGVLTSLEDGALERLVKMRILMVGNYIPAMEGNVEECNLPAFPENMSVFTYLQQLRLHRFSVPSWICGMVNLTELSLVECSGYPSLQKMPNLRSLGLAFDSRCKELPDKFGEGGGFPKLVMLGVSHFSLLEELPALEEGAMQCLESLIIINCPQVKKVPEGLERLRRLKRISVGEPSEELKERLKEGGEDWVKIKANNPVIQIEVR